MIESAVIQSDPEILGGTPVFAGTRVPLRNLIDYLERGTASTNSWMHSLRSRENKPWPHWRPPTPN